jgi:hypothetical protein
VSEIPSCPHCDPTHTDPTTHPWGVYVGPERDGDGQPTTLYVKPSDGAHVAETDARWLWQLIRTSAGAAPEPTAQEPAQPQPPRTRRSGRGA